MKFERCKRPTYNIDNNKLKLKKTLGCEMSRVSIPVACVIFTYAQRVDKPSKKTNRVKNEKEDSLLLLTLVHLIEGTRATQDRGGH